MSVTEKRKQNSAFAEGLRDGIPIGAGYFAVAFSLGIIAKQAGLNPFQGFLASFLNSASAGEYALFSAIGAGATYLEVAIITLIVNARYMLMSASLSQKFDEHTSFIHRLFVGFMITDEIFGISISRKGHLNPVYNYGAMLVASPCWAIGTALGIIAGNILPLRLVSALSVALYGMFIAIIIPPARKDLTIAISIIVSFICSYLCGIIPVIKDWSSGTRTILLTVIIASAAAIIKPVSDDINQTEVQENEA